MIHVNDLFKEKKFPAWFKEHPIFKEVTTIKKVFPGIGLPNSEDDLTVDNIGPAKECAKGLVSKVKQNIKRRIDGLNKYISSKPDMAVARKAQGESALALLNAMDVLMKDKDAFLGDNKGKLTIKLPSDVTLEGAPRPIFRKDETLFRVYNKLNDALTKGRFAKMTKLEDIPQFKSFSTENVPNSKYKVVFSADAANGAWDIATMSMRGVSSCQSWGGDYSHCTIGSVIDPFVGIIYLTSGAKYSEHGSKMIRRCIVRFVIDGTNSKPYLLLDNMYPSVDTKVVTQFKNYLKDKTGGKLEVHYAPNMDREVLSKSYMPLTEVRKLLKETSRDGEDSPNDDLDSISSYQDIHIVDKDSNKNDKHAALFEKNAAKKTRKFLTEFDKAFKEAVKNTEIDDFPASVRPLISKLKGEKGDKAYFNYSYMLPKFSHSIGSAITKTVDKKQFTSSDLFVRRLYQSYFNNKVSVIDEVKTKLTREMNGKLQLKDKEKIRSEQFLSIMKILSPKIDEIMKTKLRELVSAHKIYKQMPLP